MEFEVWFRGVLWWSSVINVGLIILSFVLLASMRPFIYRMHSKLFPVSEQQFNVVVYSFLGVYKIFIFVFNIVPYIAVSMMMK